jgi:hypothetical protein
VSHSSQMSFSLHWVQLPVVHCWQGPVPSEVVPLGQMVHSLLTSPKSILQERQSAEDPPLQVRHDWSQFWQKKLGFTNWSVPHVTHVEPLLPLSVSQLKQLPLAESQVRQEESQVWHAPCPCENDPEAHAWHVPVTGSDPGSQAVQSPVDASHSAQPVQDSQAVELPLRLKVLLGQAVHTPLSSNSPELQARAEAMRRVKMRRTVLMLFVE